MALSSRRLISISGPDAPKFLQGVITQNILTTPTTTTNGGGGGGDGVSQEIRNDGFYGAFLTATGRVLYDVFVYPDHRTPEFRIPVTTSGAKPAATATAAAAQPGESFLLEVDADEAARLEKHIRRYKLRAKFNVRLLAPGEVTVWHGWDDEGGRAALDSMSQGVEDFHRFVHLRDPRAPGLGYRMLKAGDREPLVDLTRVRGSGSGSGSGSGEEEDDVYRVRRYLFGVAEGQKELLRETALPLEGNLDLMGGIDFRKGCYVGQELTIRTKHRGVVRKRVLPVMIYDDAATTTTATNDDSSSTIPEKLEYRPDGVPMDAADIPTDTSIGRLGKKGRSAGKWLRGVGNIGLALSRLETMTDVVLPGETAASNYSPADEFVMEIPSGKEDGSEGGRKVKVKAFVPAWLRQGLDEQHQHHG